VPDADAESLPDQLRFLYNFIYQYFYCATLYLRGTSRRHVFVCLINASIVSKLLNIESRIQHRTIAQGFSFCDAKDLGKTRTGSLLTGVPNACWVD